MTHQYVIALNGHVQPRIPEDDEATAVAWASEAVLAVGTDDVVRAISRGDSTFLDLDGCIVTPLPDDPARAQIAVDAAPREHDVGRLLIGAGLLEADSGIEPGSPADLAFWRSGLGAVSRLVATLRSGHFSEGHEHRGPFQPPPDP